MMCLWFFAGPQKVQLNQGTNGTTFRSLVLRNLFYPLDHASCHWPCVSPAWSFSPSVTTSKLSNKSLLPIWSLRAKFCGPNADFPLPVLRFIMKPKKMEGLLTESVPHIVVLWRWIILLISKEWQTCMKFNISVTDCRLVAWMLIPGFGSSSTTLCSLCW